MKMYKINRRPGMRAALAVLALTFAALPAFSATVEAPIGPGPSMESIYALLGMALLQVIIIITLSGVIKTLGTSGSVWADYLQGTRKASPALLLAGFVPAQVPMAVALVTTQTLFWWLIAVNALFFVIMVSQLLVLRGMVRTLTSADDKEAASDAEEEHSFADNILQKLTRRVEPEREKDILMHHEYDGIRELDNVLPPWWVWLFYITIGWGVLYLIGMHVINVLPHQDERYKQEMTQAQAEVEAYLAQFSDMVDENTVTLLTDAATLAQGRSIFQQFCRACHGEVGEGNQVGPNLADPYWIHGGGINNVFRTIKYGVPEKGMQSWKGDLRPSEMQAVASYIISLEGTDPPNAMPPQGERWVPDTDAAPEPDGEAQEGDDAGEADADSMAAM